MNHDCFQPAGSSAQHWTGTPWLMNRTWSLPYGDVFAPRIRVRWDKRGPQCVLCIGLTLSCLLQQLMQLLYGPAQLFTLRLGVRCCSLMNREQE